jgi:pimeloyl-ACP methyl ester carboxylesterase
MEYVERAMTALRLPAATVIGVDLGAVVAHRLAALRPERVRSLVLIGAPRPDATRGADVGALPGAMARSLFEAHSGMTGASLLLGPLLTRAVADPARMPPRLIATYAAAFAGREGIAHLTAVAGAIDDEGLAGLPRVTARTLVLRGALDAWSSVGDATAVAAAVAGATLEVVPDAGRLIPEDRPAWLAERLGGWVADEPPGNTFGGLRVE